jgi:Reverse transcriptase (RNA-dependent DNA polymerase)
MDLQSENNLDGTIKYKARCVSRGFMQIPGVHCTESFAPVASDTGIRVVLGIFLYYLHMFPRDEWVLETFDVEVAFLNALLSNPVFIELSKGLKALDS